MNVYPVNLIKGAAVSGGRLKPFSEYSALHNPYIEYTVDFIGNRIGIIASWQTPVEIDVIIIGNTNASNGIITLFNNNETVWQKPFYNENYINIVELLENKIRKPKTIDRMGIILQAAEPVSAGHLFAGLTWELPRFLVQPLIAHGLRSSGGRTFAGQAAGIPAEPLKQASVEFRNIENKEKKIINNYADAVQAVIPHVIDLWPEAHEEFPPFFATIDGYGEAVKRDQDNFYWDFNLSWQEAK